MTLFAFFGLFAVRQPSNCEPRNNFHFEAGTIVVITWERRLWIPSIDTNFSAKCCPCTPRALWRAQREIRGYALRLRSVAATQTKFSAVSTWNRIPHWPTAAPQMARITNGLSVSGNLYTVSLLVRSRETVAHPMYFCRRSKTIAPLDQIFAPF